MKRQALRPPRGAKRAPLTRQRVLDTALAYVDEHGLDALTMHNVATELGVGDMSLYNHVKNKQDLLAGINDLLWTEIASELPSRADDAAWLRALGHAIRDVSRRHRRAAQSVLAAADVFPPAMLEAIAAQLGRHRTADQDRRLVEGIGAVTAFAVGWALLTAPGGGLASGSEPETERQRISRVTRALPPDTPDDLVDTAITVCASDVATLFARGLDAIIDGIGLGPGRRRPA